MICEGVVGAFYTASIHMKLLASVTRFLQEKIFFSLVDFHWKAYRTYLDAR